MERAVYALQFAFVRDYRGTAERAARYLGRSSRPSDFVLEAKCVWDHLKEDL